MRTLVNLLFTQTQELSVRQSDNILTLSSIASSLSSSSLTDNLNTLRRDLATHYVEPILSQPYSVEVSTEGLESKLKLFPAPPNTEDKTSRIENLAIILRFLADRLFPHLPLNMSFSRTLCKPVTTGLLQKLLVPALPSSLDQLPSYLKLVHRAVDFEETAIFQLLGDTSRERDVKSWADGVASHYERKRRMELLDRARAVVLQEEDESERFRVEVLVVPETPKESESQATPAPSVTPAPEEESAWGFDGEGDESAGVEEDSWGFDDEAGSSNPVPDPGPSAGSKPAQQDDADDAWGLDDEADPSTESEDSSAWDDPWGDEPSPTAPVSVPKAATRLEKHAGKVNGASSASSSFQSPIAVTAPPPTPSFPPAAKQSVTPKAEDPPVLQEFYFVSGRVKELMFLVEDVLRETTDLASSGLLPVSSSKSAIGDVIGQSAAMILELYRGLYPVRYADQLAKLPKRSMCFSNDCGWIGDEIERVLSDPRSSVSSVSKEKLIEGQTRLKLLGESWYEDAVVSNLSQLTVYVLMRAPPRTISVKTSMKL